MFSIAKESIRAAQAQQKKEGLVNTSDMDRDIQSLGKLTEDPEVVQSEQFQLGVLDSRSRKIMQKQRQLENDNVIFKLLKRFISEVGKVWFFFFTTRLRSFFVYIRNSIYMRGFVRLLPEFLLFFFSTNKFTFLLVHSSSC